MVWKAHILITCARRCLDMRKINATMKCVQHVNAVIYGFKLNDESKRSILLMGLKEQLCS